MFVQNDVYPASEYGTMECPEEREPCGAFYGLPFSGEIEDMPIFDAEQLREAMPNRHIRYGKPKEDIKPLGEYDPVADLEKTNSSIEKERLAEIFYKTYTTHPQLHRHFTIQEYVSIRFKQICNNGKAL